MTNVRKAVSNLIGVAANALYTSMWAPLKPDSSVNELIGLLEPYDTCTDRANITPALNKLEVNVLYLAKHALSASRSLRVRSAEIERLNARVKELESLLEDVA